MWPYLLSVFTTNIGNSIQFVVSGKLLYDATGLASVFGGLIILEHLQSIFLAGISGFVVDRIGPWRISIFSDTLLGIVGTIVGLAAVFNGSSWAVTIGLIVINLVKPFYKTATFSLIKTIVPNEKIVSFNSQAAAAQQSGYFVGLFFGGLLLFWFAPKYLLLVDAISYFISAIFLCFISNRKTVEQRPSSPENGTTFFRDFLKDFGEVKIALKANRRILHLVFYVAFLITLIDVYNVCLFKLVSDRFADTPQMLAITEGIYSVSVLLVAVAASRFSFIKDFPVERAWVFLVTLGLSFIAFSTVQSSIAAFLVVVSVSLSASMGFTVTVGALYRAIPQSISGKIGGFRGVILGCIAGPTTSLVSFLLDHYSLRWGYVTAGVITITISAIFGLLIGSQNLLAQNSPASTT